MGAPDLLQRLSRRTIALAVVFVAVAAVATFVTVLRAQPGTDTTRPVTAQVEPNVPAPVLPPAAAAPEVAAGPPVLPASAVRREPVAAPKGFDGSILSAPDPAVSAYQRATAIINAAADCKLDWLVLAGIGRVESDHGRGVGRAHRVTGSALVRPALVGKPLNGKQGRGVLDDTDGGKLDGDPRWDAPLGAMGLLPTTWARVAVDGDGDNRRNPQDVDDAALGAAVLLCAGGHDLSRPVELRKALRSYHRAPGFVDTVLALVELYDQQITAAPTFSALYVPPPSGVAIPLAMPEVCGCPQRDGATVRSSGSKATKTTDQGGVAVPAAPSAGGTPTPPTPPPTPGPTDPTDPVTPDPVTPDPVTPDPVTPDPEPTPDPVPPDPEPTPVPDPTLQPEDAPVDTATGTDDPAALEGRTEEVASGDVAA